MAALLLLALALAMDAFAVSIARGAAGEHSMVRALETGLAFGVAQGVMPLLGWALGALFMQWIEAVDHWIAFGLLAFLGIRMLKEAFSKDEDDDEAPRRSYYLALFAAAIATSLDAAAAGLTLDVMGLPLGLSCIVIALVTMGMCIPGYWFAARFGSRLGHYAEAVGGIVLIVLGVKILLEHLA